MKSPFWWLWLVRGIQLCRSLWAGCLPPGTSDSHDYERLREKKCFAFVCSICWLFKIMIFTREVKCKYLCYLKRSWPTQTSWRTPRCSQGCGEKETMTFQLKSLSKIFKTPKFYTHTKQSKWETHFMTLSWYAVIFAEGQNCKALSFATCSINQTMVCFLSHKQQPLLRIKSWRQLSRCKWCPNVASSFALFLVYHGPVETVLSSDHKTVTERFFLCFCYQQNKLGR